LPLDVAATIAGLAVAVAAHRRLPSLSLGWVLEVRVLGMMEKDEEDKGREAGVGGSGDMAEGKSPPPSSINFFPFFYCFFNNRFKPK